jgi:hypothetical protein
MRVRIKWAFPCRLKHLEHQEKFRVLFLDNMQKVLSVGLVDSPLLSESVFFRVKQTGGPEFI